MAAPDKPRPVIVGESNPYGSDADYALYPSPSGCAGDRLCRLVMRIRERTYLTTFARANLLDGARWTARGAREAALCLRESYQGERVWILLGRKVSDAFGVGYNAPSVVLGRGGTDVLRPCPVVVLPHPSGRNRAWSDPNLPKLCREYLSRELPEVPFGEAP